MASTSPSLWLVTNKNPYDCEREVTRRPPGAGLFVQSMDELRVDVVRNGLGVIEGGGASMKSHR